MILDRIQRYLSIVFFTALVFTQALIFVAVKAADNNNLLQAVFVEPVTDSLEIGQSIYFQAMLSSKDGGSFDFVAFNLTNLSTGLDENYQASLQSDGSWRAQSAWNTDNNYQPGQYYLSVTAYQYQDGQLENIYSSDYVLINLNGQIQAAATGDQAYFMSPEANIVINPLNEAEQHLNIKFAVNSTISQTIKGIIFDIYKEGADGVVVLRSQAQMVGSENDYSIWQNSGTIDMNDSDTFSDGNYLIYANISYDSSINALPINENILFTIQRVNLVTEPVSPSSINIISPEQTTITANQLPILVRPNNFLLTGQSIIAKISNSTFSEKVYTLTATADNLANYEYTIDLGTPSSDGANINTNSIFPDGQYNLSFELVYAGTTQNVVLGQISITLDRNLADIIPSYELSINKPLAGSVVKGDSLALEFDTSFTANSLTFSLVPTNRPDLGIEGSIPPVAGSNLWRSNISAQQYSLINDTYALLATADDGQGHTASVGPIVFTWEILDQTIPVDPDLKAYNTTNNQISLGDILFGSANVADVEFKLADATSDNGNNYILNNTAIACNSTIFGLANTQAAQAAGHNYCFYAVLSNEVASGNYYFYLEHDEDSSERLLLSYFNPNSQTPVTDATAVFLSPSGSATVSGQFYIVVGSNIDLVSGLEIELKGSDNTPLAYPSAKQSAWSNTLLGNLGIRQSNYTNAPFVYISNVVDSTTWPNETYNLSVIGYPNSQISILINNPIIIEPGDGNDGAESGEQEAGNENSNPQPVVVVIPSTSSVGINNLGINFYATCQDQGINNEDKCRRFMATISSLDKTCLDQSIYEAQACEDYLYRVLTDFECQDNNIIDGEACKNYLLEKYSSQVNCKLGDINLCNNVLRNRYLSRLVVGQKFSDNINQAIASLLGKNITLQELSDNLQNKGISNGDVLPLIANQSIKVLLAKAQKETVLEEEDKLTILNQAVIILDADGDNLPDDLEAYYGTDLNNSDTDGDGYSDGTEIINGYNPAGEGPLTIERTDIDRLLLAGDISIEQPKTKSEKIDNRLEVIIIEETDKKIKLFGKAEANTWVNLYLYSELPLVMATKTDASGNWSYDIKQSLTDGHHQVFVTVNDDTGKIVKQSRPLSFLIKEAQAVSADNYFDEATTSAAVNNFFIYYILGGAFLVFLALGIIIFINKGKNKNLGV
ncbi:MAG: hypothetical protein A2406_01415 [Candidatus Komeilibacteria bacterium RIFOXYC1_FULL_37_11]|uniref:Bacterial Ig-like domain-containing protein n=1 Tax=Candidatus Komeilibacteria bacterium RIFOXYC1_FULL_37_11 TaxID=1798555 RepID=A0A1G2BYA7_9BACT|nr:MAG: hypothetical protein A2406_01415 [Candidatus Komeilibacteria bacterium RIFOXYC1_FULL_37_11]OGY96012.1 MAG: hypothetical protein A2611_04355 [Candidatus Komeilibacteria bacterium RIFOXYD1_FULL_37_29]